MQKEHVQVNDLMGRVFRLALMDGTQVWFKAMSFDGGAFTGFDEEQLRIVLGKDDISGVIRNGEKIPFIA